MEGLYYSCSENKGADQLRGYREADLRLCFRICKKPVFSRRGSYYAQGGLPSDLEQVYNAAASDVTPAGTTPTTIGLPSRAEERSMSADDPWRRFIPSTPTASEVECHIDVKVVINMY